MQHADYMAVVRVVLTDIHADKAGDELGEEVAREVARFFGKNQLATSPSASCGGHPSPSALIKGGGRYRT